MDLFDCVASNAHQMYDIFYHFFVSVRTCLSNIDSPIAQPLALGTMEEVKLAMVILRDMDLQQIAALATQMVLGVIVTSKMRVWRFGMLPLMDQQLSAWMLLFGKTMLVEY